MNGQRLILIMKIEIKKGHNEILHFYQGQDPKIVATHFCLNNNCDSSTIDQLEGEISRQLNPDLQNPLKASTQLKSEVRDLSI
jgi:hypothetical protein